MQTSSLLQCSVKYNRHNINLSEALDTSVDYLIFGSSADKASAALHDAEVIRYFKEIEALPHEDKGALLRVIAAIIRDVKTKQTYNH